MLTTEQKNRIAVRAMAVACFSAPVRDGETHDDAMDAIVKKMEGSWPAAIDMVEEEQHQSIEIAPEFG